MLISRNTVISSGYCIIYTLFLILLLSGSALCQETGSRALKRAEKTDPAKLEIFVNGGHGSSVWSAAISNDGNKIVTGDRKSIWVWDLKEAKMINRIKTNKDIMAVDVSPDNNFLISTAFGMNITSDRKDSFHMYEIDSNKVKLKFDMPNSGGVPQHVKFSASGKYVLTDFGNSNTIIVWDAVSGKILKTLVGHTGRVGSMATTSDDKYLLSSSSDSTIKLWDLKKGKEIRTFSGHTHTVTSLAISKDEKIAVTGSYDQTVKTWDVATGNELQTFSGHKGLVNSVDVSPDSQFVVSGSNDGTVKVWNVETGTEVRTLRGHQGQVFAVAYSKDGKNIISAGSDSSTRVWNASTGVEIIKFFGFTDGNWIAITADGYFNGSQNGSKYLSVRQANEVFEIDQFYSSYYRPDIVRATINNTSVARSNISDTIRNNPAPQIEILELPVTTVAQEITLKLKLTDQGGGIGDVRLFLNGTAVRLDNGRGLKVVEKKTKGSEISRSYTLKLSNGKNSVRAIAFNGDNSMQSEAAESNITASPEGSRKPALHALVIGIQDFKNPKLTLKYSVADATLFADAVQKAGAGFFDSVKITRLTSKETTNKTSIISALKKFQSIDPDDLFILYVASHGTVDDGKYFLITSNVGATSTERLQSDALNQTELNEIVANIPSTKKMIIIDTCNAGKLGSGLQAALLTRGMSEDTAMKVFSRAIGSTILSAATSTQEALEGHNGHGLFTWVLVEGWSGKADNGKSGFIKTTDLATYVEDTVPALAEKLFNHAQYPTVSISGQGFPVGRVNR